MKRELKHCESCGALLHRADGPTPAEMRVLKELAADGATTRVIAERLGSSERTVKVHIAHLMSKMGCSTRTALVLEAQKRGLVEIPKVDG